MDYSAFYNQPYPTANTQPLSHANLQAANGNAFPLNPSPSSANQIQQLQQELFYLDPFEAKMSQSQCPPDVDHASYSNDSDAFLEELDDLARVGARPAQVANNNPAVKRNESPQGLNVPHMSTASEIDFGDLGQDFLDTPGNSSKRKAQNRAAQRAFRERKERHVKELEAKVASLEDVTNKMADENTRLKQHLQNLESENNVLKGSNITFTFPQFEKTNGNYSPPLSDHSSFSEPRPQTLDAPMFEEDPFNLLGKPISPVSLPSPPKPSTQTITTRVNNLMQQYHDYTEQNPSQTVTPRAEDGHNYFDCPKVWERIVMHPRFDEVDVESLCAELNSKVKIVTESGGPAVPVDMLEAALDEAIDEVARRQLGG